MVLLFGAIYLFALAGLRPQWPRACWLVPLVWFALAISRIRHSPLFALTALVALADILPRTRWAAWLAESGHDLYRPSSPDHLHNWRWRAAVLPVLAVALALVLQWQGVEAPVIGRGWAKLDQKVWPVELEESLHDCEQAPDSDNNHHIFNEYAYGGFMIYHTPGLKVFVDDRCELYGGEWLLEFVDVEINMSKENLTADDYAAGYAYLEKMQRRYGGKFDLALTATGSGYDALFCDSPEKWEVVTKTTTATLYKRRQRGN